MLFEITEDKYPVKLELAYATNNNFTGKKIYEKPLCFLHQDTRPLFEKAIELAERQNLRFKIFDGFRPQSAVQIMWDFCPNPMYLANPQRGSQHSKGIAIDLTLIDTQGNELDMGTPFDSFEIQSHHSAVLSPDVAKNRYLLLGIMMSAGWDFFMNEWWHYQLFNPAQYPLISEDFGIMENEAA